MGKFTGLIHNENIKIYSRARTWVMLLILAVMSALMPVLFYFSASDKSHLMGLWETFLMTVSVAFFLNTIFTVVVASDSIAGEFSWGTIKLLLIRPWSRSKILLSKYISMVLFSLLSTGVLIAFGLGSAYLFSSQTGDVMTSLTGWSPSAYSFMDLLFRYVELFLTATLAFMVSSVFRASGLAIGLSLFIIFAKNLIVIIFNPDRYEWAKYLLFTHMDLRVYLSSDVGPGGVTLGFSIAVLAAYYLLFLLIAWIVFRKRDVAA
ncbi:ABC transporter permease [Bacillus sp. FJAT-27264]|uniref:ABC transporter permease n=1 Tax=Paenibacillus sp. (strain DSM 101736 / FJAT-27264) TaxID=1850362 RepID=UPI000807F08D|nr:ABC transporter permease subunit [Bacillus sp. FJAT-27264]OBZ08950.1 ABC transporter permease [Bacillus sp. FJAT-27264]